MQQILLSKSKFAIIDNEDFEWLNQWKWLLDGKGYAVRHELKGEYGSNPRKMRKMHREILIYHGFILNDLFIDHKNRDRLDNRKDNLRIANSSQNQINSEEIRAKTGYKGVVICNQNRSFNILKPYAAQLYVNGKRIFKGMFKTKEEAALIYNELALKYFGNFAYLNKI